MDEPRTFAAETSRPSQAWLAQVHRALLDDTVGLPASFRLANDRDATLFLRDMIASTATLDAALQEPSLSDDRLATVIRTGQAAFAYLARRDANWLDGRVDRGGSWLQAWVGSLKHPAQGTEGGIVRLFGPLHRLGVLPTATVNDAHALAYLPDGAGEVPGSWLHQVLAGVDAAGRHGWGTPAHDGRLPHWLTALALTRQHLANRGAVPTHWQGHAHLIVLGALAGHPDLPNARPTAQAWGLGWPKLLGGPGLCLTPHPVLNVPHPAHLARTWLSDLEWVHGVALKACLGQDVPAQTQRPAWAAFLMEGWQLRQAYPASQFPDAAGQHGWATWTDAQLTAYQKALPSIQIPTAVYAQGYAAVREAERAARTEQTHHCQQRAAAWPAQVRLWHLQDRPAPAQVAARPRQRA